MNIPKKAAIISLCLVLCLWGCGQSAETEPTLQTESTVQTQAPAPSALPETEATEPETIAPADEAQALSEAPPPAVPVVLKTAASGQAEERCDTAVIDYSHVSDGYVTVQYTAQTESRLKVLVKGPTTTYSYNLPQGEWTVFPLSDGNGSYQVGIYQNVTGSKYATVLSVTFAAALEDEFAPFLRPNQYVNYTEATQAVNLGMELTQGLEAPLDKVAAVYDFVVSTLSYDYEKAATVKSGYLPDLDQVLADKTGICFDYAALMTAMLRSQQIPCKLVVGYAGEVYHAWISVWTQENGWIDGAIFFDGQVWKRMDPTFASSGERSDEIMDFIENGSYTAKYLY